MIAVERGGVRLADVVRHGEDLDREGALAEVDGDAVADLDVVGRAGDVVVDRDAAEVAGLVRYGAALDEARDLEVFIETHGEMLLSRKCLRQKAKERGDPLL